MVQQRPRSARGGASYLDLDLHRGGSAGFVIRFEWTDRLTRLSGEALEQSGELKKKAPRP